MLKLRKILVSGVMISSIMSMTMTVFVSPAAAAVSGDLIKKAGHPAVYYLNEGKRYVFPNEKTYMTWYSDFSKVKVIGTTELEAYPLAGNATYRPGTKLVKIDTVPTVYAVEPGGTLRSIVSEANAIDLYGSNWNKVIHDVPDSFWVNYTVGEPLALGKYPVGQMLNNTGSMDIYYYDGTNYRKFADEATFLANGYKFDDIVTTDTTITAGGTAIAAAEAGLVTVKGANITPGTSIGGSGLTVALAADTPAAATLPDGATGVVLTKVNFTASSDGAVTIQTLKSTRSGVGTPSNLNKVYLYDGNTRLTTGQTVNSSTNTTTFTSLGYVVPAGTTKTLSLVVDILAAATDNHALGINAAADIITNGATVSGSFPIMGNTMSVNNVTLGTVTVARAGSASYTRKIGEQQEIVSKFSLATANEDAKLHRFAIYNEDNDIFDNMTLWRGDTKLATGTESARFYTFVLDTPNAITKGETVTFTVKADIVSDNTNNTGELYMRYASDVLLIGNTFGYGMTVTNDYDDDPDSTSTDITIQAGEITITTSGPTAHDVAQDQDNIVLMDLSMTAKKATKVEAFDFNLTASGLTIDGTSANNEATNLDFTCDGGLGLIETWDYPAASNTSTDIFTLSAGTIYKCQLIMDFESTADASDTVIGVLDISGWTFRDVNTDTAVAAANIVPSGDITGYTMTVRTSSLTVVNATSPASKNWMRGTTDVEIAGYTFTAGDAVDMEVQDITLTSCYGADSITTVYCEDDTSNVAKDVALSVSIYDSAAPTVRLTNGGPKAINSSTGQVEFNDVAWTIPKGTTKTLIVKVTLNSALPAGITGYVGLSLGILTGGVTAEYDNKSYTGTAPAGDLSAAASAANGADDYNFTSGTYQTIRNLGTLAVDTPSNTPATDIAVAGKSLVKFSEVKLTAGYEDMTVSKMVFRNIDSAFDDNIAKIYVKYPTNGAGTTNATKECTLTSGVVTCIGLAAFVPNPDTIGFNDYAIVEVLADMQTIPGGADAADAPEFIFTLGGDFQANGNASGYPLYEENLTITDVTGTGTDTTETLATDEAETTTDTSIVATNTVVGNIAVGDIICADTDAATACETDKMFVTAISTVTMTVIRGANGTTPTAIAAAAGDNDGILKFTSILTDVNPMNVQGTKLAVTNNLATKTGSASSAEKIMDFTITADAAGGDAKIRQGKTWTTSAEGTDTGTNAAVTDAYTTYDLDGESDAVIWAAAGDTTTYTVAFTGTAGLMDDYARISFWVYWNDASDTLALQKSKLTPFTSTTTTTSDNDATALTGTCTELAWCQIDIALPTGTDAADVYFGLQIAEDTLAAGDVATANGDILAIDDVRFYNEKIQVGLALNEDVTIPAAGSAAYLKKNGTIVASGTVGWDVTGSDNETGAMILVPTGTYGDIEITSADVFSIEIPTNVFTNAGTSTEQLVATINLGNSASNGDIFWYDVDGADNVLYSGVNTTDKIATTVSY